MKSHAEGATDSNWQTLTVSDNNRKIHGFWDRGQPLTKYEKGRLITRRDFTQLLDAYIRLGRSRGYVAMYIGLISSHRD